MARYALAQALAGSNRATLADKELQTLTADLKSIENHAGLKSDLAEAASQLRGIPILAARIASYQRDLGPHGGFAWLRRSIELP
jgi:hypothetical protein